MKLSAKLTRAVSGILAAIMAVCCVPAAAAAEKNALTNEYAEQFRDCPEYDVDKYTNPYWSGEIVYNEAVFPLENRNGTMSDISLMYKAAKIVSVRNSFLDTLYVEGVDYELTADGKLKILSGGDIETIPYNKVYGNSSEGWYHNEGLNGQIIGWGEIPFYHNSQISVTYIPDGDWDGFVPQPKGDLLPKTMERLTGGGNLNIVYLGDSIMWGANSSGLRGWAPYADIWCDMTTLRLQNLYPDANITYTNSNEGGQKADWAANNLDTLLLQYNPDLAVIEFGANDGMEGVSASEFLNNIRTCVNRIKAQRPDCEIILISPYICHPERFPIERFRSFAEGLYQFEGEGVAVADVTALYDSILETKIYLDTTGNNMCHPNDFAARMFAQAVTETLTPSDEAGISAYKTKLSEKLSAIVSERTYDYTMQGKADALLEKGLSDITGAATVTAAYFKYNNAAALIDTVPQSHEMQLYGIDYEKLIFNSSVKTGVITREVSLDARFDGIERSLKLTADGGTNPYIAIDYSHAASPIMAEDYKYAIVTYRTAANVSASSTYAELYYMMEGSDRFQSASRVRFDTAADGKYHSVIIDLSAKADWKGALKQLRFDPFSAAARDDVMYLESIVMCRTAEEAKAAAALRSERAGTFSGIYAGGAYDAGSSAAGFTTVGSGSVLLGDANGDDKLNSSDILLIKRAVAGLITIDAARCDINSDGRTNAGDILMIKRIIAGLAAPVYGGGAVVDIAPTADGMKITLASGNSAAVRISAPAIPGAGQSYEYMVIATTGSGCSGAVPVSITTADGGTLTSGTLISDELSTSVIRTGAEVRSVEIAFPEDAKAGDSITVAALYLCADRESADIAEDLTSGARYETPDWVEVRFDNADKAALLSDLNNTTVAFDSGEKAVKLSVSKGNIDPRALLDVSALGISADEYKYIVYTYKVNSASGNEGEIFLCAGDVKVPTAGCSIMFPLTKSGAYVSQVLDLSSLSYWKGNVHSVRLDYFASASLGNSVFVDSVTFCRTLEEAQKYIESK